MELQADHDHDCESLTAASDRREQMLFDTIGAVARLITTFYDGDFQNGGASILPTSNIQVLASESGLQMDMSESLDEHSGSGSSSAVPCPLQVCEKILDALPLPEWIWDPRTPMCIRPNPEGLFLEVLNMFHNLVKYMNSEKSYRLHCAGDRRSDRALPWAEFDFTDPLNEWLGGLRPGQRGRDGSPGWRALCSLHGAQLGALITTFPESQFDLGVDPCLGKSSLHIFQSEVVALLFLLHKALLDSVLKLEGPVKVLVINLTGSHIRVLEAVMPTGTEKHTRIEVRMDDPYTYHTEPVRKDQDRDDQTWLKAFRWFNFVASD